VLAELKVWSVLKACRRRGSGINEITRAVVALHNLRIDVPVTA
jgi:hypothetical protein